jgi:hypothetical protein
VTPVTFRERTWSACLELHPIKDVDIFSAYRSLVVARGGTDTFDSDVINPAPLIRTRKPGLMVTDCKGNGLGAAEPCHHLVGVVLPARSRIVTLNTSGQGNWFPSSRISISPTHRTDTRRLRIAAGCRQSRTGVACLGA